jgi:hypothetical protein
MAIISLYVITANAKENDGKKTKNNYSADPGSSIDKMHQAINKY